MKLDKMTVELRPRTGWEAADLGIRMVMRWRLPVYGSTAVLVIPVAVAAYLLFPDNIPVALLIVWWLKPLYDRAPLYVISRALFGETPGIRQALRPANYFNGRVLLSLFTRFFDPARSFNLPVSELEGLRGPAAGARRRALSSAGQGNGVGITVVFALLEITFAAGCIFLILWMDPYLDLLKNDKPGEHLLAYYFENYWVFVTAYFFYVFSLIFIEPIYVASGFAQYINRRTYLEAWDIEIAFRKLAQRLKKSALSGLKSVSLILCCTIAVISPPPVHADTPQSVTREQLDTARARQMINEIMKRPEFETTIEVTDFGDSVTLKLDSGNAVGDMTEVLLWGLVAAIVLYIVFHFRRLSSLAARRRIRAKTTAPAADTLFGLDIRPESLPDDIAAAAAQCWRRGAGTEAISLLYRGALVKMINQDGLELPDSATEGDCVRIVSANTDETKSRYFSTLVANWQAAAYAHRLPMTESFNSLCSRWKQIFGETGG